MMRVLVADDDPVLRLSISSLVQRLGYDIVVAEDGVSAWDILRQPDPPRLAILDWIMPGVDGLELCRRLRASTTGAYIYTLLLTAKSNLNDLVQALDSGADDFLTKPAELGELAARLTVGQRLIKLHDDLHKANQDKQFEATHDPLTALWNRRAILEIVSNQFAHASRTGTSMTLMLADVDHFKSINDLHGHAVGDAVLHEVASRMAEATRKCDWLGRYGGEEFLVVCPDCAPDSAGIVAERIRQAVASAPVTTGGLQLNVTVSIGFATTDSRIENDHDLICIADFAMYSAKHGGRNRVESAFASAKKNGFGTIKRNENNYWALS